MPFQENIVAHHKRKFAVPVTWLYLDHGAGMQVWTHKPPLIKAKTDGKKWKSNPPF